MGLSYKKCFPVQGPVDHSQECVTGIDASLDYDLQKSDKMHASYTVGMSNEHVQILVRGHHGAEDNVEIAHVLHVSNTVEYIKVLNVNNEPRRSPSS